MNSPVQPALRTVSPSWRCAVVALLLSLQGGLAAAQARPVVAAPPAEAFFASAAVLDAELSPSGQRLAITTALGADRVTLVVFDLGPTPALLKARRVAHFKDADVVNAQWVGDDRLVFSLTDLAAGSGEDRRTAPGLLAVDADGSNLRLLIAREHGARVVAGGMGAGRDREPLGPNHRLLHVPRWPVAAAPDAAPPADDSSTKLPGEVVIGSPEFDNSNDLTHLQPMWLDTRSGRVRSMALRAPPGALVWWFDGSGQARLVQTRKAGRLTLHWRAPGQSEWRPLAESGLLDAPFRPHLVDDAGTLYVTHPSGPDGTTVLSRFDFERGAPAAVPWVRAPGFDFAGRVQRAEDGNGVAGVRLETDAETTVWLDPAIQAVQERADARFPGRVNRVTCRRCGQPDGVALVLSYSDRHPGELWLLRRGNGEWQRLLGKMPDIDPQQMAPVEFQRIRARDGRDLPLWLTLPAGQQAGQRAPPSPAVVLVHGGPWVRGGHWRWDPMAQFLASRGYLVISPEFRGSAGYGQAHFRAGFKQWGLAMQDDVADALLWAQKQGLASDRACIAGASYGGYASLMGLVRHPELYRCGVAWVAVTDPFLMLEGSFWVNDDISGVGRRYSLPEMVGDARADAAMLTEVSPLAQAARIRAPLLLAFGEADRRVPLAHGTRLRQAMRDAGNEPQWVTYPNEAHSWRLPATHADFARRVEQFLEQHLAPKRAP